VLTYNILVKDTNIVLTKMTKLQHILKKITKVRIMKIRKTN